MKVILCTALVCFIIATVHSLSCQPYHDVKCDDPGTCEYGKVSDICGQCDECGKGPDEPCGGIFGHGGRCGDNLKCTNPWGSNGDQNPGKCIPGKETYDY